MVQEQEQKGESGMAGIRAQGGNLPKPTLNASPGFGAWLAEIGGSLAFTTYQSARLFFVFAGENGEMRAQERIVGSAMGLVVKRLRPGRATYVTTYARPRPGPQVRRSRLRCD